MGGRPGGWRGEDGCLFGDDLQRIAQARPARQPAEQRPDLRDPQILERERHPGARGFVRSSAVEDDLRAARDFPVPKLEVLGKDPESSGDHSWLQLHVLWMAKINDRDRMASPDLFS